MKAARYLVVHLPAFRLERCGWTATDVAGLIDEVQNAMRLVAVTPAAAAAGLRRGMTASAARALVPEVVIEELDPVGEYEDRTALKHAFHELADRVAFPWDDDLVLEISAVSHLHGGDRGTAERALLKLAALGHHGRVAVADHPLAAAAVARAHEEPLQVVPPGDATALAPLALDHLRPGQELFEGLRAVGITTIGQLALLDPASVAGRFGAEGERLHRVARGLAPPGLELGWDDPLDGRPSVSARLGGATSTLQVRFALPGLLARLADRLAERDLAAVRLEITLKLEGGWGEEAAGRRWRVPVRVGRPTRSPEVLGKLVNQRLEGVRLSAPVDELILEATETAIDSGWQPGLADRTEAKEPLPELMARLADHLGEAACGGAELVDTWRPEAAWRMRAWPPREPQPALPGLTPPGEVPEGAWADDPVEVQEAWEPTLFRPRPAALLPEPAALQVRVEDDQPVALHLAERGWTRVQRALGPERLEGEWWDPARDWARDYWVVQVDDRTAWIYRDRRSARHAAPGPERSAGIGRWFLHGWF